MKLSASDCAVAACAIALCVSGCTWVSTTAAGQDVRILDAAAAADCEKIGKVSSKTSDRVIIFARSDRKVRQELESLARNEAAELGGDAIVPVDTPEDGRQTFDLYRCATP